MQDDALAQHFYAVEHSCPEGTLPSVRIPGKQTSCTLLQLRREHMLMPGRLGNSLLFICEASGLRTLSRTKSSASYI